MQRKLLFGPQRPVRITLTDSLFRAHDPSWAHEPLSGAGAGLHGGRFNPVGMQALYTALLPMTASWEAQAAFPFKGQPVTICAYEAECEDIADLTDPAVLAALAITQADLACPWERLKAEGSTPPSWIVSTRLVAAGYAGIKVPSFAVDAAAYEYNAVFWRWGDDRHHLRVIDDHGRLPRNRASWPSLG